MIPYWMYLIGVYLAVGCGHAYTLYEMSNLLADQTKDKDLRVGSVEAFISIFLWPVFLVYMVLEPRLDDDEDDDK
jgi:hypothetical protein